MLKLISNENRASLIPLPWVDFPRARGLARIRPGCASSSPPSRDVAAASTIRRCCSWSVCSKAWKQRKHIRKAQRTTFAPFSSGLDDSPFLAFSGGRRSSAFRHCQCQLLTARFPQGEAEAAPPRHKVVSSMQSKIFLQAQGSLVISWNNLFWHAALTLRRLAFSAAQTISLLQS